MEKCQSLGYRNPLLQHLEHFTGEGEHVQHDEGVEEQANAVGQPAEEKAHNENDRSLQHLLFKRVDPDALRQPADDDAVADEDD